MSLTAAVPRGGGDRVHRPGRLQGLDPRGIVADQTAEPQAGYREELGEGPRDPEPSVDHIRDADLWDEVGEGLIDDENGSGLHHAVRHLEHCAAVEQVARRVVRVAEEHHRDAFEVSEWGGVRLEILLAPPGHPADWLLARGRCRRRVLREGGLEHERLSARSCRPGRKEQRLRAAVGRHYHLGADAEVGGEGPAQPGIFQVGVAGGVLVEGPPGGF